MNYAPVEFIINNFNTDITMTLSATLDISNVTMDVSCVADLYVDTTILKNTFKFQTDSDDITDLSENDIKYFVYRDAFWSDPSYSFSINFADAVQDYLDTPVKIVDGPSSDKNMICHDFVRYLAQKLFNTYHGVDLFSNESELINDIRDKSQKAWAVIDNELIKWDVKTRDLSQSTPIHGVIYQSQETPSGTYDDGHNLLNYYTNLNENNVCRSILRQLAYHQPNRFQDISGNSGIQSIPFIAGDIISIKLIINPANNQHNLTGLVEAIEPRSYKVRFNLVDNYDGSGSLDISRSIDESNDYRYFYSPTISEA